MNTPQKPLAERITQHSKSFRVDKPEAWDYTPLPVVAHDGFRIAWVNEYASSHGDKTADANAELIAEAFNVTHETGKTPRELADMLKATIERFDIFLKEYAREHSTDHKGFTDWKLNRLNS